MNKPQVNINLNINIDPMPEITPDEMQEQIHDVIARAHLIQEQLGINAVQGAEMSTRPDDAPNTSRHYQAVKASQRITDAIEFINKEIRMLKGLSEAEIKTLQEVKHILLGM
jgi:hypothetical protein